MQLATIDPTLDLCARYPLWLGGPRQCGIWSLPDTAMHGQHWESSPRSSDLVHKQCTMLIPGHYMEQWHCCSSWISFSWSIWVDTWRTWTDTRHDNSDSSTRISTVKCACGCQTKCQLASLRHAQCSFPLAAFGTSDLLERSGSRSDWLNESKCQSQRYFCRRVGLACTNICCSSDDVNPCENVCKDEDMKADGEIFVKKCCITASYQHNFIDMAED